MRQCMTFTLMIILTFAALGCERGDLREIEGGDHPPTAPSDTVVDGPSGPGQTGNSQQVALLLAGHWQGDLLTEFIDDFGVTHQNTCTTDLRMSLSADGASGGKGKETDYIDGKQVFMKSFDWHVDAEGRLHLLFADRHMTSVTLAVDATRLVCRLMSSDTMETDDLSLHRVGE